MFGLLVASNSHVEMFEIIIQSIESEHFRIFNILGGSCASSRGEHISEKCTNDNKTMQILCFHGLSFFLSESLHV